MSEGVKRPLYTAKYIASEMRMLLVESCERIEIAGSIRREKPEVGDGELVAIPRVVDGVNLLHQRLDALVAMNMPGGPRKADITDKNGKVSQRWGDEYRAVSYSGMKFDIFMTDADSWGYQFLLRTGPAEGNTLIMSKLKWKKAPFRVEKGEVLLGETRVPVRNEDDFFFLIGLPYMEPKDRTEKAYKLYFGAANHAWGNAKTLIPRPALGLRLIWNYGPEALAAYPIPIDFIDEETGGVWANVSLDRRNGPFELVERGSIEAQYQHEFLVGVEQRRVEQSRLREILWQDQEISVPGYKDVGDLPVTYLLAEASGPAERVLLSDIIPTQRTVYRWGVYNKAEQGQRWANWCQSARGWDREQGLADAWGTAKAIRFAGDNHVYLVDGHHRYMAAREINADWLLVKVETFTETFEQACGMMPDLDDNTDYEMLADVMDEVLEILAEGVPA